MQQNELKQVLLVCDSLGGGGAERQLALLAAHLPQPWRASVISLGGGVYADRLRTAGVELTLLPRRFRFDVSPLVSLAWEVRRRRPAVVHSWGHMSCLAADPVCRSGRIPHIAGVIRRGAVTSARGRLPLLASRLGDLALANSRAGLAAFGVPDHRGRVLYNGMAPERLAAVRISGRPAGPFRAVMAATMDHRKDYPTLIAAVRRFAATGAIRITALGGGEKSAEYRALAADLIAKGAMEFPGQVAEPMDYLGGAHAGVLVSAPGWGEGISNSIMEYMAAGLPVIATDAGGTPELVTHGETGFLIAPGDAEALAAHLRILAEDPDRAEAMGRAGRARIERDFTVEAMTRRAVEIYEEAIALKPQAR